VGVRPSREILRWLLTATIGRHVPGSLPDIAIVSSPRSGSTWLMEAMADQRGYKYINEPDHKAILDFHHALSFEAHWTWLDDLSPKDWAEFARFLTDDRRSRLFGRVHPTEAIGNWRTERRVLKLVRANALIERLAELNLNIVYLVRHPIAQALSCIRRAHRLKAYDFLTSETFRSRLSSHQVKLAAAVLEADDRTSQYVLQWCLENYVPLHSPLGSWGVLVTTYEDCVVAPQREAQRLCAALTIPDAGRLLRHQSLPSRVTDTSTETTKSRIARGQSRATLGEWRQELRTDAEERLFAIVAAFDIDLYRPGADLPDPNTLARLCGPSDPHLG
jgi:hypothetical protein